MDIINHGHAVLGQVHFFDQIAVLGKGLVIVRRAVHGGLKNKVPYSRGRDAFERPRIQLGERTKIGKDQMTSFRRIRVGINIVFTGLVLAPFGAVNG